MSVRNKFELSGRIAVITGGGGLLGRRHGQAISEFGGVPILVDRDLARVEEAAHGIEAAIGIAADITDPEAVDRLCQRLLNQFGRIDILINNAANNPKVEAGAGPAWSRLERFPLDLWHQDLAVGLTGAFLCARAIGPVMAAAGQGVILNVASDLALIAPDQRLYRIEGIPDGEQPVKPVTYSVVKAGLVGLTRYLATYWNDRGVRVNAIAPGGVAAGQEPAFVARLVERIPLGRMANADEYMAAVAFLVSDASSYMTGTVMTIDGGRTCW